MSKLTYSRVVTVRTPKGAQKLLVPSETFLSRSLACFRALDHFRPQFPRAKLTVIDVSEVAFC